MKSMRSVQLFALMFVIAMAIFAFTSLAQADVPVVSGWDGDYVSGTTALDTAGTNDGTMSSGVTIVPGPDGGGRRCVRFQWL